MGKYYCAMDYKRLKRQTLVSEFKGKIQDEVSIYLLLSPASSFLGKSTHFLPGLRSVLYKMKIMVLSSQ